MKTYRIRYLLAGQVCEADRLAVDETALRRQCAAEGLTLLSASRQRQWREAQLDWLVMVEQLLFLLQAGLNITEALRALQRKERRALPALLLSRLLQQIEEGNKLSVALLEVDPEIDYLLISTVASNEDSGTLTEAFARYLQHARQMRETRRQLTGALIYPCILLLTGLLIFTFLLLYVIPRFSHIFSGMTGDLPAMSLALLAVGEFVEQQRWGLLILLLGLPLALVAVVASRDGRRLLWQRLLHWPWFARKLQPLSWSRLYHMLALLTLNGVPLHRTLQGLAQHYEDGLRRPLLLTVAALEQGDSLSDALHDASLTDEVINSLLRAGERSGNIGECFSSISVMLDAQNTELIRRFGKVFEPLLMLALGLGIGAVVVLMYMPIFELASSLQ